MPMCVHILDLKRSRPWLDLENGELVSHVSVLCPEASINHVHQCEPQDERLKPNPGDLIVVHIDNYSISAGLEFLSEAHSRFAECRVIAWGFGVEYGGVPSLGLSNVQAIGGNDLRQVLDAVAAAAGTARIGSENQPAFLASDFSRLGIDRMFNYPIRAGKGCQGACPFCERSRDGGVQLKDPSLLDREVFQAIEQYGIRALTFWDSHLDSSEEHLEAACQAAERHGLPWRSNGMTVRGLTPKIVKRIAESGCYLVSLGIESFDPKVRSGKHLDPAEVKEALDWLRCSGVASLGFFIVGLEGDTLRGAMNTLETAGEIGFDAIVAASAIPWPGTPLAHYAQAQGRILSNPQSWSPDDRHRVYFETEAFSCQERQSALEAFSKLEARGRALFRDLERRLGGPAGPSSPGNIRWH